MFTLAEIHLNDDAIETGNNRLTDSVFVLDKSITQAPRALLPECNRVRGVAGGILGGRELRFLPWRQAGVYSLLPDAAGDWA